MKGRVRKSYRPCGNLHDCRDGDFNLEIRTFERSLRNAIWPARRRPLFHNASPRELWARSCSAVACSSLGGGTLRRSSPLSLIRCEKRPHAGLFFIPKIVNFKRLF